MTALISHTTFDSLDTYAMSVFWGKVLEFTEDPEDPNEPGDKECMIGSADGSQRLLFIEVADVKQVKNRLHLDLQPARDIRDEELQRLLGIGARSVDDRRRPNGSGWVVLADPEGNEFCIATQSAPAEQGGPTVTQHEGVRRPLPRIASACHRRSQLTPPVALVARCVYGA